MFAAAYTAYSGLYAPYAAAYMHNSRKRLLHGNGLPVIGQAILFCFSAFFKGDSMQ